MPTAGFPDRVECRLTAGTPATPPAPKLQPWQISKLQVKKSEVRNWPYVIARPLTVETTKTALARKPNTVRPILKGNHYITAGPCKLARCVWCKKSRTRYICKQCSVSLCLQICFEEYHTVP
ncbi:hypothetical protein PYW07_014906 [Mythimna separata]|uniref:PiggyBac transposable element-derived protein 4 C-terminal zinc-finger domain-containing protein n=1 Tax=Mythimna separata TaxID=271217 RepID=A0AAD7Z0M8_MYTSE|nr:hypothetical protein PYW07_014906 [Mythimna separata]